MLSESNSNQQSEAKRSCGEKVERVPNQQEHEQVEPAGGAVGDETAAGRPKRPLDTRPVMPKQGPVDRS
jgi:hypothetical protein